MVTRRARALLRDWRIDDGRRDRDRSAFKPGRPRQLFQGRYVSSPTGSAAYDVSPDRRFLRIQPIQPEPPPTFIQVTLNWYEELKRTK